MLVNKLICYIILFLKVYANGTRFITVLLQLILKVSSNNDTFIQCSIVVQNTNLSPR